MEMTGTQKLIREELVAIQREVLARFKPGDYQGVVYRGSCDLSLDTDTILVTDTGSCSGRDPRQLPITEVWKWGDGNFAWVVDSLPAFIRLLKKTGPKDPILVLARKVLADLREDSDAG